MLSEILWDTSIGNQVSRVSRPWITETLSGHDLINHKILIFAYNQTYNKNLNSTLIIDKMSKVFFALLFITCLSYGEALRVDPESSLFVDQYNRTTIFHGVNAVYKVFPFYPDT